jgi:hypothetical protein
VNTAHECGTIDRMPEPIVEQRSIPLPQGGTLEMEMTQAFIDRLRQHFGLFSSQPLEDDHVRMYVWGSFSGAIDRVEQGQAKDGPGQQTAT